MNSGYARKSPQELKEQARQQMQTAARAEPCIAVTEPNWKAMIGLQKTQVDMLTEMMQILETLTTKEELVQYMNDQLNILTQSNMDCQAAVTKFQTEMRKAAAEYIESTQTAISDTEKQAGKMSEQFLKTLSEAEDRMEKCLNKAFWISLMPTAILIIWGLIRHIWLQS